MTAAGRTSANAGDRSGFESCRIAICDDQPEIRAVIDHIVGAIPRFVVIGYADDGDSCLELVRRTGPHLLILDVNIPGGGPHVAKAAKDLRPELHIVVFSGRSEPSVQRAMLEAGADQYVLKTGRVRPLLQAIETGYLTTEGNRVHS